ncbi:MAG: TetR/AcrR family transcriptional regulator [Anaerolineales bacterium]
MTRDDILEAAAQVFRQKGFHGASMQDIAEAVKLQKASLYHHVSSKQEILLALLDRALDLLFERLEPLAHQNLSADEKLRQMILAYLQALTDEIDLASVLLLEHRSLEPELHARHVPKRDRFEALWREVIAQGRQEGRFAVTDVPLTVRAILGILNWTITWYRPQGVLSVRQIGEAYADLLLNGLLPRSGDQE